jgi:diacylglycerol kinase (ATP)
MPADSTPNHGVPVVEPATDFTFSGRLRSFRHALAGIALMLRSQHNAWVHLCATVLVIVAGVLARLSRPEWCWIVLAIVSVWTAEALNTAFEFLCDVTSPQFHPGVKRAKDVAAGAVLIAAIGSVAIGAIVFLPHLRELR